MNLEKFEVTDKIAREEFEEIFLRLLKSVKNQNFSISLNGAYGTGKTTFLKQIEEKLTKETVIYFSAWEHDYAQHPFPVFLDVIMTKVLEDEGYLNDTDFKKLVENIIPYMVGAVVSLKTGSIEAGSTVTKSTRTLTQKAKKFIPKKKAFSNNTIEDYLSLRNDVKKLKEKIEEKIIDKIKKDTDKEKNIYVFIDELERCRPTFAVEFLEIVKHFFHIPNLVFVFAMDREQLKHSITTLYGHGMDGDGYLRRFFDIEINLPQLDRAEFIQSLFEESGLINNFENTPYSFSRYDIIDTFTRCSNYFDLSLRKIAQIFIIINVTLRTLEPKKPFLPRLYVLLIVLRSSDADLFNAITNRNKFKDLDGQNVLKKLKEYRDFDIGAVLDNDMTIEIRLGYDSLNESPFRQEVNRIDALSHKNREQSERIQELLIICARQSKFLDIAPQNNHTWKPINYILETISHFS